MLKYLLIFSVMTAGIVSCIKEVPDEIIADDVHDVTMVARMTEYSYRDVDTKALNLDKFESDVKSLYFIVFDEDGDRVSVKKGNMDSFSAVFHSDEQYTDATVCCVANMRQSYVLDTLLTLSELYDSHYKVSYAPVEETGCVGIPVLEDGSYAIPMIGVAENINFSVIGTEPFAITLRRLFSKVVVNFGLDLADKVSSSSDPYFRFAEYTVSNLPAYVRLAETEDETDYAGFMEPQTVAFSDMKLYDMSDPYSFVFYVPESSIQPEVTPEIQSQDWYFNRDPRYKPVLAEGLNAAYVTLSGSYLPTGDGNQMGYDLKYNIFLGENNFDSFSLRRNVLYNNDVTIRGFSGIGWDAEVDHRVDVEVNGFLVGFERTSLLDSHYEVRPLRVKFDKSFDTEGEVFIEVLNADDETGEVPSWVRLERPLTTGGVYCDNNTKRRYFTTDLVTGVLAESGKSVRYNPLISEADRLGEIPVWVYVDENSAGSANEFNAEPRRAVIRVGFRNAQDKTLYYQDYIISQRPVYPVKSGILGMQTYGMEFYEEYLHNYDVIPEFDDVPEYDTKSEQGLVWGLDEVHLSRNKRSVYTDNVEVTEVNLSAFGMELPLTSLDTLASVFPSSALSSMMNAQIGQAQSVLPYYDFYNSSDMESVNVPTLSARDYEGYEMNVEIIHNLLLNHSGETEAKLNGISLNEDELSVIAYCYNKNKRDADGNVATLAKGTDSIINTSNLRWYAPSLAELASVMANNYSSEEEFSVFADNLYWSCQPSYDKGEVSSRFKIKVSQPVAIPIFGSFKFTLDAAVAIAAEGKGLYLSDDTDRARATRFDPSMVSTAPSSVSGPKYILEMSAENSSELQKIELTTEERDSLLTILDISVSDLTAGNFGNLAASLTKDEIIWLTKFVISKFDMKSLVEDFKSIFEGVSMVDWDINQTSVSEGELVYDEGNMKRTDKARVRCLYNPNPPLQYRRSPNVLSTGGYTYTAVTR